MSKTWVLIGNGSLLAGCGDLLLQHGQEIAAVVTNEPPNERWAAEKGIRVEPSDVDLAGLLRQVKFDHLASIAHLSIIPTEALRLVPGLAINFHDGPLPELAGLNVTSWAILRGEKAHGVTWHAMTERLDAGRVLEQRRFDVSPDETAFLLNAKCYAAGLDSFADLVRRIAADDTSGRDQDLTARSYFGRWARPAAAAAIDWQARGEDISALVRALDFGSHWNPLCLPKMFLGDRFVAVGQASESTRSSGLPPGTILSTGNNQLEIATGSVDVVLGGLAELDGTPLSFDNLTQGKVLPQVSPELARRLTDVQSLSVRSEETWRTALGSLTFPDLDIPAGGQANSASSVALESLPEWGRINTLIAAIAVLAARRSGTGILDIAYSDADLARRVDGTFGAFDSQVPVRITIDRNSPFNASVAAVASAREELRRRGPLSVDLWARDPQLRASGNGRRLRDATISIGVGVEPPPASIRFAISADATRCELISQAPDLDAQLGAIFTSILDSPDRPVCEIDLMSHADHTTVLRAWNDTTRPVPELCIHDHFIEQARRTPDATALIFHGRSMSYRELDERTNRLARHLRALGVGRDVLVGIFLQRSFSMVEAVLATLKAGGAYVPLDPTYPADRLAFMVQDSELQLVVSDDSLQSRLPFGSFRVVNLDAERPAVEQLAADSLGGDVNPSDLAYVIYTSGSTGRPKGVMIEHRNVANFAVGMDETIDRSGDQKTWLAVTSLSFDISVLELLWTLARGFTVVLHRDDERESFVTSSAPRRPVDFSLFYFSSDESEYTQNKYRLLLDGARFADQNGFVAVWTPERHFHAFGGLFPNPAVTSAAVAAITQKVGIRAGSVVSPLHSALRIAEEWSVVDNLSNGRVAISFAPGWQPNDFVLQPGAFKARKDLMFEQIEMVRRLWRGDALPFVNGTGETVNTRILPRPVQKELPVWVTIAGNPESFVAAARAGANVLTHLLGQTVKEVGEKVALYRKTWREAGHAGEGIVTMMAHTFVGDSDESVREIVREPMKAYLRSAVGLIRDAAWSFPTFKQKTTNAKGEFDADSLSPAEMDALLDHAFERYYSTSGLFGTVESAGRFVDAMLGIGVDEIACLIDFGVATDKVLASLPQLAKVANSFKTTSMPVHVSDRPDRAEPETIPSLMISQGVTHFQCTPTMAQMLLHDNAARPALQRLRQMLVGGEALPESLARDLASTVGGVVTNVYGPTETTVWSSTARVARDGSDVTIGFPIANTSLHVLDRDGRLAPIGVAGELHIGGKGVVRGYWKRPELTAERFVADPFDGGRLYRTGDLVRRRRDGALEFLGRLDHQVKVRGHRIELGEIEARLSEHPAVGSAVVVARDDGAGPDLVAYLIARNGSIDEADVRTHLRARVPEYMMPRTFVRLTAFPMTPNRKIDRKALPAPQRVSVVVASAARPAGSVEQTIAAIWCEVLELPEVGSDTNFADVGGHSLAMVQVLGRLKDRVSARLTLVDLFRYTTIRALAGFLATTGEGDSGLEASASRAASRRAAMARGRVRARG